MKIIRTSLTEAQVQIKSKKVFYSRMLGLQIDELGHVLALHGKLNHFIRLNRVVYLVPAVTNFFAQIHLGLFQARFALEAFPELVFSTKDQHSEMRDIHAQNITNLVRILLFNFT